MSKLVKISIDVSKIDKSRLYQGKKGTYLNADVWINDEPDQYGNDASINMEQTKEEREAKAKKIFIGNGKKMFGFDDAPAPAKASVAVADDDDSDLPF